MRLNDEGEAARARIAATISGDRPDRTPVAAWRHFPEHDQDPAQLAAATLAFQASYGWDLVKVTPATSFCLRDWGACDRWAGDASGKRQFVGAVVQRPQDWESLALLGPDAPQFLAQRHCLCLLRAGLAPGQPLVQTIFSPLAQAKNLATPAVLLDHLQRYPEAVRAGLDTIARSTAAFVASLAELGVDGIFYAVQHCGAGLLDLPAYLRHGADAPVLDAAAGYWCNMLHLHGDAADLGLAKRLRLAIVNWHGPLVPPPDFDLVACGGISSAALCAPTGEAVEREAAILLADRGRRLILGTDCVLPLAAGAANLRALRDCVRR